MLILLSCSTAFAQQHGTVTYVYTDPQGTPLAEADASGNITATFDYAPYGSQAMGTAPNGPGYTGHVNDPDTGLVYMQARYYDPSVGRFLSTDPVGPHPGNEFNFNRYNYANDNPIRYTDPTGRVVHLVNEQKTILKFINSRAAGVFTVDKHGNLQATRSKGDTTKYSSNYGDKLLKAISSKDIISVSIGATYKDPASGAIKSVDSAKAGGGVTIGPRKGGPQSIIISGNSYNLLKDSSGAALKDSPADILAHEFVGHAVPRMIGGGTGNAVMDENEVRSEIPGSGLRAPEPSHKE